MKALSLFSGIGGFDLGFQRAGMDIVGMCEIDKHAQKVLRKQFPDAELYDNVKKIGASNHARGSIDIICGGFPCQDVSVAGKRAGLDGKRSGLWFEFARIIDEIAPKWLVIENVPGLFTSANGEDFATIIQWLANSGYGVGWRVFDSQHFGLAQRRKRVFIVASLRTTSFAKVLFEQSSWIGNSKKSRQKEQENSGGVAKCLTAHQYRLDASVETLLPIAYSIRQDDKANTMSITEKTTSLALQALQPATTSHHAQMFVVDRILWEASHGYDPARISTNQEIVPTLSAKMGTGGNNVPLVGVRRLTPTECERLQGFPDGWTDGQPDGHRYKQLGNAVSVNVAEWIGKRIMEYNNE
jgi:DNA (cytosine-5)-methyltransferase 1